MYKLDLIHDAGSQRLEIGFLKDVAATNSELVTFVEKKLTELIEQESMQGKLLKITGAASLPVTAVIIHKVGHLYGAIAVYDPKLSGYVVSISHSPDYKLGLVLSDKPVIV